MLRPLFSVFFVLLSGILFAQMPAPNGTIDYGNEWIDYDRTYLKITVTEDGMHRISPSQISGILGEPLSEENAQKWELSHQGKVIPIEVTEQGIIFYGEKNRGDLDRFLFEDPDVLQLNDQYSMYSDTAAYYLSLAPESGSVFYRTPDINGTPEVINSIIRTSEVVYGDFQSKFFRRTRSGVNTNASSIYFSHYDVAEGYGSRESNDLLSFDGSTESIISLPLPNHNGNEAIIDLRFGLGFDQHQQSVAIDGQVVGEEISRVGWGVEQLQRSFIPSDAVVEVSLKGNGGQRDKANIAWARATYPASLQYDEDLTSFQLPPKTTAVSLRLANSGPTNNSLKVYSPATAVMAVADFSESAADLILPATATEANYHLVAAGDYLPVSTAKTVNFSPSLPGESSNYLIVTSERLNGPAVNDLAAYRSSPAGGGYAVHVAIIEDIYDAFGYGVPRHPMALKNYLAAAQLRAPGLKFLFLVGKGREYENLRSAEDLMTATSTFFLPSFGLPASDNLLTAEVGGVVPALATGRLPVVNAQEISIYLDKLREVEGQLANNSQTLAGKEWMKKILHLGGGGVAVEQVAIRNGLEDIAAVIEASDFGGDVLAFYKTSSDPIEQGRQEAIFDRINQGTSIVTFFGHSSSQTFDFNIDDPNNYFNKGRYPYMISLGCYSGDSFTPARGISERFVLLRDKAAVTFAASKGVGFITTLRSWGNHLYNLTGNELYGAGVGEVIKETIRHFQDENDYPTQTLLEQFTLTGDPAFKLHPSPGTDLVIDPAAIRFSPQVVPAQNETYEVSVRIVNIGRGSTTDSVFLQFRQQLPDGQIVDLARRKVRVPKYEEIVSLELPSLGIETAGQNRILVTIDPENELLELPNPAAENNNELINGGILGTPLTFVTNSAEVAYPPPFAVIGGDIALAATTTNALAPERNYLLQVSTRRDFSNPLTNIQLSSPGGVIRYQPTFAPADSTTYYWRISPDSAEVENGQYIWSNSSFTWLANQPESTLGWAAQDPGQTVDGVFDNIRPDSIEFGWNSAKTVTEVRIHNGIYKNDNFPRWMRNSQRLDAPFKWRISSGMSVLVMDSLRDQTWYPNLGDGEYNTRPIRNSSWDFDTRTPEGRDGMMRFITEAIEPGRYVYVYSLQRGNTLEYYSDDWEEDTNRFGRNLLEVLEREGAERVRLLSEIGSVPYAFSFRKSFGPIDEVIAETQQDSILLYTPVESNWPEGEWDSPVAGPAKAWEEMRVEVDELNFSPTDEAELTLIGITPEGAEVVLRRFDLADSLRNLTENISDIAPEQYPYLRVNINFQIEQSRTIPTVGKVYFNYQRYGDVAINPSLNFSQVDSIEQGSPIELTVGYENLSPIGMDSLLVDLEIIDLNNQSISYQKRNVPLPGRGQGNISFTAPSEDISSNVLLNLTLNPREDQPEENVRNNSLSTQVKVGRDVIAPTLQVFFDGQRIVDGAIVSAQPEINVRIKDNSTTLFLNDTSALDLALIDPMGNRRVIRFANADVEFIPATSEANEADIFFRPSLLVDGEYTLVVSGKDRSGNIGGRLDFQKTFSVINERMVGNVLPYPNPFTTQTRFVYTLTGNAPPEVFRIQIMTISGRVVRDINILENEQLRIGTHQTDFSWDGTDEYGDMLANGVYLYRVISGDEDGSIIEKFDNGTDQFFANDLGKIVILR